MRCNYNKIKTLMEVNVIKIAFRKEKYSSTDLK